MTVSWTLCRTLTQRSPPCIPTRWLRPRRCNSLRTAGPSYPTQTRSRPCAAHNRQHFAKGGRRITCLRSPEVSNNTTEIDRVDQQGRSFVRQGYFMKPAEKTVGIPKTRSILAPSVVVICASLLWEKNRRPLSFSIVGQHRIEFRQGGRLAACSSWPIIAHVPTIGRANWSIRQEMVSLSQEMQSTVTTTQ